MKKILYNKFGDVSVMEMADTATPTVTDTTLLVKVKAVSINPLDWKIREGQMKMMSGSTFPKGIGIDFSGVIEKVGAAVKSFHIGDAVFGLVDVFKGGALAEYIVVSESDIALKPPAISFEQAATLAVTGSAALQILAKLNLSPSKNVLINGATGGIGMYLTQFVKQQGAHVTSVTSERLVSFAEEWKSDVVFSYEKQNVLKSGRKYDVVIDLSGRLPFASARQIMKDRADYVNTTPGPKEIIGAAVNNLFSSKKYHVLLLKQSANHLASIAERIEGIDIVVGKTFLFTAFQEAYQQVPLEKFAGKAVITLP
ncbi:MAG TPA: NAD(P)-dependent alcohol dehydrogenase [Cyclobacteriaceae bacterium]